MEIETLLDELATPDLATWEAVEDEIMTLWSRSGSDTADLMLVRARDLIEIEDYETAIEHLTALTDHAPDFAEGWHLRATAFYSVGEHGLALDDLRRALALNPDHFGALTGVGIVMEELGNYEGALAALKLAIALNPHRETITNSLARVQERVGESTL